MQQRLTEVLTTVSILLVLSPLHIASADVQITGLNDLPFGTWSGTGNVEQTDQVCIHNSDGPGYQISATASGGAFRLANGGNTLDYEVRFQGSSGGMVQLSYGTPTAFSAANTAAATCSGGTNASIRVTITESALSAAKSGSYSGTLSLLLEPN